LRSVYPADGVPSGGVMSVLPTPTRKDAQARVGAKTSKKMMLTNVVIGVLFLE
jgi:hypothetical protein